MATADIFEKLKDLQTVLVEKYKIEGMVKEAPEQLSTQEELLARMQKEFIEKNAEYEDVKANIGRLKLELEDAIKSRESGEKGMDNITTHREYEALEKQISEATVKESDVRKELQKFEKSLDEIKEELKLEEDAINTQKSDLNASKDALNSQLDGYKNQLQELDEKEKGITPGLDQEILFKFQRIIQRNSEGIVAVRNGICTGCHMMLPAQFANTVRDTEEVMFCPYCSRILYYEEADENSNDSYYKVDSTGSLVGFGDQDDDSDFKDEDEDFDDEELEERDENEDYDPDDEDDSEDDEDDEDEEE